MAPTQQSQQLWKIACGPACGFLVRSHDKAEVLKAGLAHDKASHGGKASESDMRGMMEPAEIPAQYRK
jgi:predicted small metal-binding protein